MDKKSWIIIATISTLLLIIGFNQFSISNLDSKYSVGDTASFDIAAVFGAYRGTGCTFTYSVTNPSGQTNTYTKSSDRTVLGGVDAYRVNIPNLVEGTYKVSLTNSAYQCSKFWDSTKTTPTYSFGQMPATKEEKSFDVVDEVTVVSHEYYDCGDSSGSMLDIYWFNSAGIREDMKEQCPYMQGKKCTSSGINTATCSGSSTSIGDKTINNHHTACYNGDVYYYTNYNVRQTLAKDCLSSEVCTNSVCTANNGGSVSGCTAGKTYSQKCDLAGDVITITCNQAGNGYVKNILTCSKGFTCSNNQCEPTFTDPDELINGGEVVETCETLGGVVEDGFCVTGGGTSGQEIICSDYKFSQRAFIKQCYDEFNIIQKIVAWFINLVRVNQ
jgi:hypothetical protein